MITLTRTISPLPQKVNFILAENQQMLLAPIGDVHYGTRGWPERKFKRHIEWCMDRGAMFVGVGEFLDFTSYSQREIMNPLRGTVRKQIDDMVYRNANEMIELLKPTKGRWLGLVEGDHRWDFPDAKLDEPKSVDQYIAEALKTAFLGTAALIRLHPKSAPKGHPEADTILYLHHGVGSSQTSGGHLNAIDKQVGRINADLYLMGHSHSKVSAPTDRIEVTPDGILTHRTILEARTGAWLTGYYGGEPLDNAESPEQSRGSYVEEAAMSPSALGGICIGVGFKRINGSAYYRPTLHLSV